MKWEDNEITRAIEIFTENFNNRYLVEIKRKDIINLYSKFYDNLAIKSHTESSFVALIYNILSILTENQYGLSGFSKKLKELVEKSSIKFSKNNKKFYIDTELF